MRLVRYNPWAVLDALHNPLGGIMLRQTCGSDSGPVSWSPAVDVHEEPSRFVLRSDLPGINPEDVELTIDQGVLTIKGERSAEHKTENGNYRHVERRYGAFQRSFKLPETADPDGVEASYNQGVLEISLAKKEQAQPRKIRIEHQPH